MFICRSPPPPLLMTSHCIFIDRSPPHPPLLMTLHCTFPGRSPPRRGGGPGRYGRSPPRYAGRRRSPPRGARGGRSPPPARRPRTRFVQGAWKVEF